MSATFDKQDAFNRAVSGLASQGFQRSTRSVSNWCAYRGDGGKRCAVGWLIPDGAYSSKIEGDSASQEDVLDALKVPLDDADAIFFLGRLQKAHDNAPTPDVMRERLIRLALNECLTIPAELAEGGAA
jgi:hypothetical protein